MTISINRFPLPLENGHQCKIIQGFGKTICQRLDDKLNKHKEDQIRNNLDIPVSPVPPVFQATKTSRTFSSPPSIKAPSKSHSKDKEKVQQDNGNDFIARNVTQEPKDKPREERDLEEALRRSVEKMPSKKKINSKSQEEIDFEEALRRSVEETSKKRDNPQEDKEVEEALRRSLEDSQEKDKFENSFRNGKPSKHSSYHNEDEDFKLALQLSQQEDATIDDQEEQDRLLAEKLQQEFNRESKRYVPRPTAEPSPARMPFTFDDVDRNTSLNNHDNVFDDDEDLPDIPEIPLVRRSPVVVGGSELRDISNTKNAAAANKKLENIKKFSKLHELSFNSDDDVEKDSPIKRSPKKSQTFKPPTPLKVKPSSNAGSPSGSSSKKETKKTPKKEYVPRQRTGAYAVLITLYKERCKDEYKGHVSKAWLQEAAQPLADESFSCTSKSEHYTAWSGVSTLVKHELITKWSNPAKFTITDKGMELAARIIRVEEGDQSLTKSSESKRKRSEDTAEDVRKRRLAKFDHVDDEDLTPIRSKTKTSVGETSAADFDLGDTFDMSDVGLGTSSVSPNVNKSSGKVSPFHPRPSKEATRTSFEVPQSSKDISKMSTSTSIGSKIPVALQLHQLYNEQMTATVAAVDRNVAEFELAGGTFDVVLCVDNTETAGGGAGGRKTLKEETVRHLQRCGVNYDRRNLNIGDFLWIARERVEEVPGQYHQREPRELVLPYIVERKRLDDLWQSVKDGRYEEQKFRLKGCGLKHLYYLIEDFPTKREFWGRAGGGGNLVTPEAIEQAIANTAVQEGFTVKRTDDQKGTIEYLTMVTRLLRRKYQHLTLRSCTQTDIADGLVGRRDTTLLPFKHFNETSRKNKDLKVGEVWAKMLLRLKGLSVDMAYAIVTRYPTLRDLLDAYSACSTPTEKIKLINEITYGIENKRKIPKNVAEAVMKVWNNETL